MKKARCYSNVLLVSVCWFFPTILSADEQLPDMAFLEYLAELVEVNGELIGPQDLADKMIKPENKQGKAEIKTKDKIKDEKNKPNEINTNTKQEDK